MTNQYPSPSLNDTDVRLRYEILLFTRILAIKKSVNIEELEGLVKRDIDKIVKKVQQDRKDDDKVTWNDLKRLMIETVNRIKEILE